MHLKESNVETVFIQTGFKHNRSKFLKKLTDNEVSHCLSPIEISGRSGYYTEKPSLIEKYSRRDFQIYPQVFNITYLQFGKKYVATRSGPKDEKEFKPQDFEIDSDFDLKGYCMIDFIITHDIKSKKTIKFLHKYFRINDCHWESPNS